MRSGEESERIPADAEKKDGRRLQRHSFDHSVPRIIRYRMMFAWPHLPFKKQHPLALIALAEALANDYALCPKTLR
jgi:hypothetical protein